MDVKRRFDTVALIVAGGRGRRAGPGAPKPYRPLPRDPRGRSVLAASVEAFAVHAAIDGVSVVVHADDVVRYVSIVRHMLRVGAFDRRKTSSDCVIGGSTRQRSVFNGLLALAARPPERILVHDAVRPFVSADLITRCLDGLGPDVHAVAPALPVTDSLKRIRGDRNPEPVSHDRLYRLQTPQAFFYRSLLAAHRAAPTGMPDDSAVAESFGMTTRLVRGENANVKLTHEPDFT